MAGLVPAIHALLSVGCSKEGVDARDVRAFTPVFDGLMRGHDDGGCIDVGDLPHFSYRHDGLQTRSTVE
jgi:hypothetical protein